MLGKAHLPRTFFLDIDGTLLKYQDSLAEMLEKTEELPGTVAKINNWIVGGHIIILTTGRPESCRVKTIKQLEKIGLCYHQLVMGVGVGARILVNDLAEDGGPTAVAICLKRDAGIQNICVESGKNATCN